MNWPLQSRCDVFYGDPRGRNDRASPGWEASHLTRIAPPFEMTYAGRPIRSITIHEACASSLARVLAAIARAANDSPATLQSWGVSIFAGSYNYRVMRGSSRLSMHAYGCAIDLDPDRNAFHDVTPHFAEVPAVVDAFEAEGWIWGGRWTGRGCDGMHFQAALPG